MSPSPRDLETTDFGPNEWLVDEMYEKYLADPDSVDAEWQALFRERGANGRPAPTQAPEPGPTVSPTTASPATSPAAGTGSAAANALPPATPSASAPTMTEPATKPAAPPRSQPPSAPIPKEPAVPPGTPAAAKAAAKDAGRGESEAGARTSNAADGAEGSPSDRSQVVLRGAAARTVANMDVSLSVPTATSVRTVPVKLLIDNRIVINNHLTRARGGKVSFTHLIGYALVKALRTMPEMNNGFEVVDGKPNLVKPEHVNLGLAIDVRKSDGTRQLLVPSIKRAETMGFADFWTAYEEVVTRTRNNKLTVDDFQNTTISLTNPGTIGTNHSVPRLMAGQGCIIGVGAMEYPPEWEGASVETLARNAVGKVMTLT